MPLGREVGRGPSDVVLDGDAAPPARSQKESSPVPKKGQRPPQFSAHVYCGQTARWIKMALSMEVGLSPSHTVLDGDPALLPKKGTRALNFRPISIVAKELDAS